MDEADNAPAWHFLIPARLGWARAVAAAALAVHMQLTQDASAYNLKLHLTLWQRNSQYTVERTWALLSFHPYGALRDM